MLNDIKVITAALILYTLTGCAATTAVRPAPSIQFPNIDQRLLQHCPSTYSVLPVVPTWDDVQAAHTADIQQAEACRIKDDTLIDTLQDIKKKFDAAQPTGSTSQPNPK